MSDTIYLVLSSLIDIAFGLALFAIGYLVLCERKGRKK